VIRQLLTAVKHLLTTPFNREKIGQRKNSPGVAVTTRSATPKVRLSMCTKDNAACSVLQAPLEVETGHKTKCWIWPGVPDANGYMRTHTIGAHGRRGVYVHRAYYEKKHGPISGGYTLDHLCGVRACCNPEHLQVVGHISDRPLGGAWNLDEGKIQGIRHLREEMGLTFLELGRIFGVTAKTIRLIVCRTHMRAAS
jgi:hypothetical protein